jgi:hypothetical protein
MKYRVFKESVGWSEGLFIIDERISFKIIKDNPQTSFLNKNNYLGLFEFDEGFLKTLQNKKLKGYKYYYEYLWEGDRYEDNID